MDYLLAQTGRDMRLLRWLWERTDTEFCVTDGQWDWDEWHSLVYGFHGGGFPLPDYVITEPHYYVTGRTWGQRVRMIGDLLCFVGAELLLLGGLYLLGQVGTYALLRGLA